MKKFSVTIRSDGNSLFRSLAYVLTLHPDDDGSCSHIAIRFLIRGFINRDPHRYLGSVQEEAIDEYLDKLAQFDCEGNGMVGTDVEIQAAADLFQTTIWCYCQKPGEGEGSIWVEFRPETNSYPEEAIYLENLNSHFEPVCNQW